MKLTPEPGPVESGPAQPGPLDVAREAARVAGRILLRHFADGVAMRGKQSYNLVSDADLEAERAIIEVIGRTFPDHAILGEETRQDDVASRDLWVIDPLDGTNNFAHRIEQFAVSIAYCRSGVVECGVVFQPLRDEWYVAERGGGAFLNGRPMRVADHQRLDQAMLGVGFYYDRGAMMEATLGAIGELFHEKIHGIRRFGAAALDLCYVGCGMLGGFFEYELAPWDFAAARLFVEEAGGRVTTARGEPLPLARSSILATNGPLHAPMLAIVGRRHPSS